MDRFEGRDASDWRGNLAMIEQLARMAGRPVRGDAEDVARRMAEPWDRSAPRIRTHRHLPDGHLTARRAAGRQVAQWPGLVEIANQPGTVHDFRVAIEVGPDGSRVAALVVLAREGGPPVTPASIRSAWLGDVIGTARRQLSAEVDAAGTPLTDDDGTQRLVRPTNTELRKLVAGEWSDAGHRRASSEVRDDVARVAKAWRKWKADGGRGSHRAAIAKQVWGVDTGANRGKVKRAMNEATELGLVPTAKSTRKR